MGNEQNRTTIKKKQFIELFFKNTGNVSKLCQLVDISRNTYYDWIKSDEEFAKRIEAEKEGLIDFVESKMFNLINEKNPTMVIFFLKTQGKRRGYIESAEHIHSGGMILELSDKFLPKLDGKKKDGKAKSK